MSRTPAASAPEELTNRLLADPDHTGLFLDFDGTLAPIVSDPQQSTMPERLRPVLEELAETFAVLAVVSGRPADFLIERVQVRGALLLGLYGLQEAMDGEVRARPEAAEWQPAVDQARRRLQEAFRGREGVYVEDKGLAVAVHYRNARQAREEVERLVRELAEATALHREPGKLVEELRPPVDWDKGAAVSAVADEHHLTVVAYVGDDLGDLVAFDVVGERGGLAAGVDHGEETPQQVRSAASVLFDGTEGVADWLESLAARS